MAPVGLRFRSLYGILHCSSILKDKKPSAGASSPLGTLWKFAAATK